MYNTYVRKGGYEEYDVYRDRLCTAGFLDFDRYVRHLKCLFPIVYVYRYEHLKEDCEHFVSNVCQFIAGCSFVPPDYRPVNRSLPSRSVRFMRRVNPLFYSKLNVGGVLPFQSAMRHVVERLVK